ncbi:M48 family metallopeptidase [Noviherbaspirillum massiliense]|uniref:M48 family metallopeptidase n=1 Tax=Noviherbaspirillum massiliense TaxID=1465823 RepID=UPI000553CDDC|nr:M48 family metallopeptidase [Noviherbaspirillum massiliense]
MEAKAFDQLVARLELFAQRAPVAYKIRVGLLAALGYGYVFGVLAVLVAILVLLGWFASGGKHLFPVIKIAIPLLMLTWVILRALWVRLEEPEGRALTPQEAPELFAVIDDMRRRLRGPRVHGVLLTDEYNAAVVQTPRLGMFGWQKNHLILGLPLMQALSPEQFLAVLAHEYGHLAGAHSRFASWIYRIRKSWHQLMDALDRQGSSNFLFKKFFDWYSPFFAAYSFVLARANEYQADQVSRELVGSRHAADALINSSIKSVLLREQFWPKVYEHAEHEAAPSFAPFEKLAGSLTQPVAPEEAEEWLQAALACKTGSDDTHPSLSDRLRALGEAPRVPEAIGESAAQRYLAQSLSRLTSELDQGWRERVADSWRERFEHVQQGKTELAQLQEKSTQGTLELQQLWDLAYWTEEIHGGEAALPRYQEVLSRAPDSPATQFAVGRLLLTQGEEAGIAHLEKAMELDPARAVAANEWIGDFLWQRGREDEARTCFTRAAAARQLAAEAAQERASLTTADKFMHHELDEDTLATLREQLALQPRIAKAWLARKVLTHNPDEEPVFGLAVQTRFWHLSGRKYVSKLCQELSGIGHTYIVVVNAFDDDAYRAIGKSIKKVKGTLIYRR